MDDDPAELPASVEETLKAPHQAPRRCPELPTVRDAVAYRGGYIVCYKLSIVLLSRRSEAMSNLESSNNLVLVPVPAQHLPEVYSLLGSLYGRGIPATWRRANGDEHAGRAE